MSLYGHCICPFATRVEFALAQWGIEHDLVDLPPSAVRGPDFPLSPEFVEGSGPVEGQLVPEDQLIRTGADMS